MKEKIVLWYNPDNREDYKVETNGPDCGVDVALVLLKVGGDMLANKLSGSANGEICAKVLEMLLGGMIK